MDQRFFSIEVIFMFYVQDARVFQHQSTTLHFNLS